MPPDELVFFVDRSLGRRYVAEALKALGLGLKVEIHDDHFPLDASDEEWLSEVGKRNWVVLTKDKRVRKIALEREALLRAGVRAFVLTTGNLQGPEMARVFVSHRKRIIHLARTRAAPFIAGVTRSGVRLYPRS